MEAGGPHQGPGVPLDDGLTDPRVPRSPQSIPNPARPGRPTAESNSYRLRARLAPQWARSRRIATPAIHHPAHRSRSGDFCPWRRRPLRRPQPAALAGTRMEPVTGGPAGTTGRVVLGRRGARREMEAPGRRAPPHGHPPTLPGPEPWVPSAGSRHRAAAERDAARNNVPRPGGSSLFFSKAETIKTHIVRDQEQEELNTVSSPAGRNQQSLGLNL